MHTKGAVELLLDGHAGMFHIGVPIAEQEGFMAGALRGGMFTNEDLIRELLRAIRKKVEAGELA